MSETTQTAPVATEPAVQTGFSNHPFADLFKAGMEGRQAPEPPKQQQPAAQPVQEQAAKPAEQPSVQEAKQPEKKKSKFFTVPDHEAKQPEKAAEQNGADEAKTDSAPDVEVKPDSPVKHLRDAYERVKSELAELKAAKANAIDPVEIENLRAELQEREKLVARLRYEESSEYKDNYVKPLGQTLEKLKKAVPMDKAEQLSLLAEQPATDARANALNELIQDLPLVKQLQISNLFERADEIREKRTEALAQARERAESFERENRRRQQQQVDRVFQTVAEDVVDAIPLFKEKPDLINKAKKLFSGDNETHESIAAAAFWAVYGQEAVQLLSKAQSLIAEKDAELSRLRAAGPALPKGADKVADQPVGFMDKFRRGFQGEA